MEVDVSEAGQSVEPPGTVAAQDAPGVGFEALQAARRLDADAAGQHAGKGHQLRVLPVESGVEERPGEDRRAGAAVAGRLERVAARRQEKVISLQSEGMALVEPGADGETAAR
jgi:hypothetical protein